uniref:Uncharacterized protein n=1 Tax=Glossina palpalis gambiensis TaxID=67801 RepID=A0A1B0B5W1_9MUSC
MSGNSSLTLSPNLTPSFLNQSPREALRRVTKFLVDAQFLNKRFRQIPSLVHPDKFGTKILREQNSSAGWRSLINKTYTTLSNEYMLKPIGFQLPGHNDALNKEFLMEIVECTKQIEEATNIKVLAKLLLKHNLQKIL